MKSCELIAVAKALIQKQADRLRAPNATWVEWDVTTPGLGSDGLIYCPTCAEKVASGDRKKHPEHADSIEVTGGWEWVTDDVPSVCARCARQLTYAPTNHCVGSELDYYEENWPEGFRRSPRECFHLMQLLEAYCSRDGSDRYAELVQAAYAVASRPGAQDKGPLRDCDRETILEAYRDWITAKRTEAVARKIVESRKSTKDTKA